MNYDNLYKWIAAAGLVLVWGGLIVFGFAAKAEAQPFITFIQGSLVGIGAHGLTVSGRPQ